MSVEADLARLDQLWAEQDDLSKRLDEARIAIKERLLASIAEALESCTAELRQARALYAHPQFGGVELALGGYVRNAVDRWLEGSEMQVPPPQVQVSA